MKNIYFQRDGQIKEHEVIAETDKQVFINLLDKMGTITAIDKEVIGAGIFDNFADAKEHAMKNFEEGMEQMNTDYVSLKTQTEPVVGDLMDAL